MAIITRKDVWKLADWDPILLWYAKAIRQLQTKPIKDPLSWRYQAAIHEYRREVDPLAQPTDQLPSAALQKRFWNQCQHGSWFFLPWHRMYLSCFERIIRRTIKNLNGPSESWALPYWNYSDTSNPNARKLPPAFRATKLPDGSPNPLRVSARTSAANNGLNVGNDNDVDIRSCLRETVFAPQPTGVASFGGPRTGFHHPPGPAGTLERVPHGSIHNKVGGGGFMSGFNTAGLDPIFWLHHCNIDRLWEVWRSRNPQNLNPLESAWLTDLAFELHDETGAIVSMTSSQVTDTTAAPLSYEYQDVSDPLGGMDVGIGTVIPTGIEEVAMAEMVGATAKPLTLTGGEVTTALAVNEPTGPAAIAAGLDTPQRRIFLNIENIVGEGYSGGYEVYLNLPPGDKPSQHPELFAGLLPMFGVAEAGDPTGEHPTSGLQYSLEITDVAGRLQAANAWDPNEMRVTFVPDRTADELESDVPTAPVQVGRVSLYYE